MTIVNFATNGFKRGQNRLSRSLGDYNHILFTDYVQIKSPTHEKSPYEFKVHAIDHALKQDDIVLWCDASLFLVGDLTKIEKIIQEDGYFMEEAGHYAGRWTNEHSRSYFKVTDQEMFLGTGGITFFSAGLLGLNRNSAVAMEFFKQWKESAKAGCFKGSWNDHRHDMTAGSIIAQRLGMKYQRGGSHMAYLGEGYSQPEPGAVFHLQGI